MSHYLLCTHISSNLYCVERKPETLFFFEQIKRQKFYFNLQSGNEPANFRGRRETTDEFIFAFNLREVMQ